MEKEKEVIQIALASIVDGIQLGNMTVDQCQPLCDLVYFMNVQRPKMSIGCWEDIIKLAFFLIDQELNSQIPLPIQRKLIENVAMLTKDTVHCARCENTQYPDMLLAIEVACLKKWYNLCSIDSEKTRILSQLQQICTSPSTGRMLIRSLCSTYHPSDKDIFHFCNINTPACPFLVPCKEYLKWAYKRGDADIGCEDDDGRDALQILIHQFVNLPVRVTENMDDGDKQSLVEVARYLFRKGVSSSVTQRDLDYFSRMIVQ